ncbi:potassium channel family protein [Nosocomiicoccus ampullae]|uniref:Trk system potassium uptake protein TrkA n=1 Tax=Nosocomiicoccus ampullae TaxID=489910 RepID=A0A9Q2HFC5_9STAP|nr:TrkA family potassium uptake protein [Nosocomiicoccus ampullae]MBB5176109.1 trk system potassium uptake protein TrkA [Nosocomiicoccus ampullae]QYA47282.1 TrkA family potassium uptake protein [Nosocomiicoccus ampullae]QYA48911.1 TrkA family potassium uptake protein [Nosocomiicoccus ampullae]
MKKEFAVIGLGRFGSSIIKELRELNVNVLAIDKDEAVINDYKDMVTEAVIGNTMDENVLKSVGITNFDHVIVAIGENLQASILTTLILKDLGVEKVTVKAQNDYHGRVLEKIGADAVIHPERDIGRLLAHRLVSAHTLDILEISDDHSIVEFKAIDDFTDKTLEQLDFRNEFGVSVLAIKRHEHIIVSPDANTKIIEDDILILIASDQDLSKFEIVMGDH